MESKLGSKIGRVCVYCGASSGNKPVYKRAAVELGLELVRRKMDLVYGGGSIGLMGQVARVVHSAGRHVLGVIPKKVLPEEIVGNTVGEVRYVEDMHQRKEQMACLADAFIALPGGYGTMEELLEIITWSQLGIHNKPIGLLNVDGYYNLFLALIDNAVKEGFISADARKILIHASDAADLLCKLEKPYSCIQIPITLSLIESNSTPETLRVSHCNSNQIEIVSNCLNVGSNEGLPLPISLQIDFT